MNLPPDTLQRGVLLAAAPRMLDANFRRTVILLCDHGPQGSFGLILNRPLQETSEELTELFYGQEVNLRFGGPVQTDTLHFLHDHSDQIVDAAEVSAGVSWGGDFEAVKEIAKTYALDNDDMRFFIGYTGWGPEQLAAEVESHDWIVATSTQDSFARIIAFETDPADVWSTVMKSTGGVNALMANFPPNPHLN